MSSSVQKLFVYNRPLPEPFDRLSNKKVKISSRYGDGTEATLSSTVIKAVHAYLKCVNGTAAGALGLIDRRAICEYKSAAGPDIFHLAVYDPASGNTLASVYDRNTETFETYTVGIKARDGSAVLMAMMPYLMKDTEFQDSLTAYSTNMDMGFPDFDLAKKHMAILCDNAYRRIADENCTENIKIKIDNSGNLMRVTQTQLDSGSFTPKTVLAGEFSIFSQAAAAPLQKPVAILDHSDFIGKYILSPSRNLSQSELSLVPTLEPWYILPEQLAGICKHAFASTGKPAQMRNFLLRGPAGTGKTAGAKAIAAGFNLPYVKYTCSAGSEIFDFIGQVFPETGFQSTGDAELDQEHKSLLEMGGITYENVAKLLKLPGLDDMDYNPAEVYRELTGVLKPDANSQDCMAVVLGKVTEKVRNLCTIKNEGQNSGQAFTYVETDFIRALKHGYVIELQEPSTIMQPGVLVGLNSLLEQNGSITLPTGEIINRHPDTVVVVTTNSDYEGCRNINQSVIDRMNLIIDIELPPPEIMTQRAMSITGCEDEVMVTQMVQVINDMAVFCQKNSITDGSCGMRGLIDWIISTEVTDDPYESALYTIISKAASNSEDRQALISSVLEPMFAPKRRTA